MDVAVWTERKLAQWERAREHSPHLQLSRTGRDKSVFILRYSDGTFEDTIIFGRPYEPGVVDMTDASLRDMIEAWTAHRRPDKPHKYDPNLPNIDYAAIEPVRAIQAAELRRQRQVQREVQRTPRVKA